MVDPEKTGIAVGISLISCLEADIHAFEIKRPPSWIFPIPVGSHSLLVCPNGKLDPENIGIAVEISLISGLEAKIHAFDVLKPPFWTTHFRFGCTVSELVPLECWTQHMGLAVGILSLSCLRAEKHATKECQPPSWIFPFPVWSHSHVMSLNGKVDPENMGIAV